MEGDADLQKFRLSSLPSEICYVPDFISEELERNLLQNIYNVPNAKWTNLSNRRLQNWGGTPHIKGMVEEPLPRWLADICTKVSSLGLFEGKSANHVLINEYLPGQGIMPHTDGPLYHPTVAIISMAGGCMLDFFKPHTDVVEISEENMDSQSSHGYPSEGKRLGSVYLQPRSLVIFRESAYTEYLHGIRETFFDDIDEKVANSDAAGFSKGIKVPRSDSRISMTIRVVLRTVKASKIFGKTKF